MSISADEPRADGFVLRSRPFGDPDVVRLVDEVQAEYVVRYGGPDETPIDPAQFDPPNGLFLLGYLNGRPVACGGWRTLGPGVAEIKRMYVSASARRRGLAARVLAEVERTATAAGHSRIVLETGDQQPEALGLYARHGYRATTPYGHYRDAPGAIHLGKELPG